MVSLAAIRMQLKRLLHLDEPPHRTALAFAMGTFIAFSPAYGMHTLMVLFCAWAFRLNVIALLAGAFINNPWTIVPIMGGTVWIGFLLLGIPQAPPSHWNDLSLNSLYEQVMPYLIPFVVGGIFLSVLAALIGYPLAYAVIIHYRKRIRCEAAARLPHESP